MSAGNVWPELSFFYPERVGNAVVPAWLEEYSCMAVFNAEEIADRSDYYQTLALWPQPQIPASIKDVADSRIVDFSY